MSAKPIVAGTDGSTSARHAVRWAATEAALRHRGLHLISTYLLPVSGYPDALVITRQVREAMTAQAATNLDDAERAAAEVAPEVTVTKQVIEAGAQATLRSLSRDADLVVLGSRGLGGFTGLLVGSTAVGVAAHAACPVVVVRGDREPGAGPVVVGVDGTPVSEPAIAFAFEEASLRGAPLVAVHAWQDGAVDLALRAKLAEQYRDAAIQGAEELLSQRLAGWQEKYPDVRVSTEVRGLNAAGVLVRLSKSAQLVVVGSRGRGGFTGLTLGSTSQALIRHADAPVAVVRTEPWREPRED